MSDMETTAAQRTGLEFELVNDPDGFEVTTSIVRPLLRDHARAIARIAELEAEQNRLQEALRLKYADTIRDAVLAERVACAKIADDLSDPQNNLYDGVGYEIACDEVAAAIRARPAP